MRRDHIVVLKKIPVDPDHIGSLRLGAPKRIAPPPSHSHGEAHAREEFRVDPFFRIASFFLFATFLFNPVLVAYAEEAAAPTETPSAPEPEPDPLVGETTIVIPPEPAPVPLEEIPDPSTGEVAADAAAADGTNSEALPSEPEGADAVPPEEGIGEDPEESSTGDGMLPPEETGTTTDAEEGGGEAIGTTTENSMTTGGGTGSSTEESPLSEGGTEAMTGTTTTETATTSEGVMEPRAPEADPATTLEREQTPEERAADRAAAEAAMREQIRKEVEAEIRSECVSYGDDGYYCLDKTSAHKLSAAKPIERVVSERGEGGDKEIFLVRTLPEGETREAITANANDDEFPSADGNFRMIVWQTLENGRWQIAYRAGTNTIEYLTANQNGNGHPVTDGARIVWQGWTDDQWDIFVAEPAQAAGGFSQTASSTLPGIHPGWRVMKISENSDHDMFPKIAGNVITWQEHRADRWVISVYDLTTGATRTIEPESGGTGEDPTVALLYKERMPDGRVAVRARDLATGEAIPIRADELPEEPATLPIPEQQGALPAQQGTSTVSVRPEGEGDDPTPDVPDLEL